MRARAASASASVRQTTAYDDPLPASSAGAPAAALDRRLERDEPRLHVVRGRLEVVAERRQTVDLDGLADRAAERVPRAVHVGGRAAERRGRDHDRELGQGHRVEIVADPAHAHRAAPRRQNGTSAPSVAAMRSTSRKWTSQTRDRRRTHEHRGRVGRTAAEPGTGRDALVQLDRRRSRRARCAARTARFVVVGRAHPAACGPVTAIDVVVAGRITSSSCGSLTGTTSIVELVVAVGARAR